MAHSQRLPHLLDSRSEKRRRTEDADIDCCRPEGWTGPSQSALQRVVAVFWIPLEWLWQLWPSDHCVEKQWLREADEMSDEPLRDRQGSTNRNATKWLILSAMRAIHAHLEVLARSLVQFAVVEEPVGFV